MRLVVEEVSERRADRMSELPSGVRRVGEVFEQPLGREGRRVLLDRGVGVGALAPQLLEVRVELLIERTEGPRGSREAAEPATVGEQEVIQDPVDRAKERLAVALALLVGKRGADGVELLVHPAVVSGHHAGLLGRNYGWLPPRRPLSGRLI